MSIGLMMWDDKTKILFISYNNHFLNEFTPNFEPHFEIQRAQSEQVAFFLIREADIKLIVFDVESPLISSAQALRKGFGYSIGLIGVGSDTKSNLESAFKSNCDAFIARDSSPQNLILTSFALNKRLERTQQIEQRVSPARTDTRAKIKLGDIEVFPKDYLVHYQGEVIRTTPTQFKLLLSFISKTDELLTREWLQENIWEDSNISHRSIDAHISKLKKLIPSLSSSLINIYGKGYMLNSMDLREDSSSTNQAA